MPKWLAAVCVMAAALAGSGAGEAAKDAPKDKVEETARIGVAQVGAFTADLLPRLRGENMVTSPYLVSSAFALLREGARGQTLSQVDAAFHFPGKYEFPLVAEPDGKAAGVTVSLQSMLFVGKGVALNQDFLTAADKRFRTKVESIDLADRKLAAAAINRAVAAATHDKVKDAVSEKQLKNGGTNAFVLAQTLYFKGVWKTKFDKALTKGEVFHVPGPVARMVAMMGMKGQSFLYGHMDGVQWLKVPYAGEQYSLLILLPDDVKGFAGMNKRPDVEHIQKMLGTMETKVVDLYMPRFSILDKHDLTEALQGLGVTDAFDGRADFSGLKSSGNPVKLDFVSEEAVFAVDEEGTEAASAVTAGASLFGVEVHHAPPKPIVFRIDHPCVMVLLEEKSGLPLFVMGLNSPAAWEGK